MSSSVWVFSSRRATTSPSPRRSNRSAHGPFSSNAARCISAMAAWWRPSRPASAPSGNHRNLARLAFPERLAAGQGLFGDDPLAHASQRLDTVLRAHQAGAVEGIAERHEALTTAQRAQVTNLLAQALGKDADCLGIGVDHLQYFVQRIDRHQIDGAIGQILVEVHAIGG